MIRLQGGNVADTPRTRAARAAAEAMTPHTLHSGWLTVRNADVKHTMLGKKTSRRWCVLHAVAEATKTGELIQRVSLLLHHKENEEPEKGKATPLWEVTAINDETKPGQKAMEITIKSPHRSIKLQAEGAADGPKWLELLRKHCGPSPLIPLQADGRLQPLDLLPAAARRLHEKTIQASGNDVA